MIAGAFPRTGRPGLLPFPCPQVGRNLWHLRPAQFPGRDAVSVGGSRDSTTARLPLVRLASTSQRTACQSVVGRGGSPFAARPTTLFAATLCVLWRAGGAPSARCSTGLGLVALGPPPVGGGCSRVSAVACRSRAPRDLTTEGCVHCRPIVRAAPGRLLVTAEPGLSGEAFIPFAPRARTVVDEVLRRFAAAPCRCACHAGGAS